MKADLRINLSGEFRNALLQTLNLSLVDCGSVPGRSVLGLKGVHLSLEFGTAERQKRGSVSGGMRVVKDQGGPT